MKIILALLAITVSQPALAQWRVSSDRSVGGFVFPESAAYDAKGKALYVGNFGGQKLAPAEKDWNTGSLSHWSETGGVKQLAAGFKGPADFTVIPGERGSMTVVVPDLPQSQLRFIQLRR